MEIIKEINLISFFLGEGRKKRIQKTFRVIRKINLSNSKQPNFKESISIKIYIRSEVLKDKITKD